MLGLRPAQIRSWANKGFLDAERGAGGELRFGFRDLIVLRAAGELSAATIPPRKIASALEKLREQLPRGRSLAGVRISADGERIVVRDGGKVWNPESGQSLFDFAVSEIAAKTRPFAEARAEAQSRADEESADRWYELGCELELTSVEEAQRAYERAIRLDPDHADAHINLGRLLHEQRAPALAEKHYRRALEIDSANALAAFDLGVALEDLGRLAEAIGAYERALELDPSNADAHYNLAGIFERRGEKADAVRHLKEYRALVT